MTKDFPNYYSASIKIQFSNGLSLKKFNKHAKGDPENPMTEKEICDKSLYLLNNKHLDVNKAKNLIIKILDSKIKKDNVFTPITWFDTLQEIIK
jgi:2-methylcitrate dehydratase PrpD